MIKIGISVAEFWSFIGQTIMDHRLTSCTKFAKKHGNGSKVRLIFNKDVTLILEDPKHVIVVHCNSGKGRTGTAICALLLYAGYYDNLDDCLKFYGY